MNIIFIHTTQSNICGLSCFFISCGSSGRTAEKTSLSFKSDQVKVKQEPGTEDEICSFSGAVKQEKTEDGRRSACMVKPTGVCRGPSLSECARLNSAAVNMYLCLHFYAGTSQLSPFLTQCLEMLAVTNQKRIILKIHLKLSFYF